jgi:ComF family protein
MVLEKLQPKRLLDGLIYLFFPSICAACNRSLPDRNQTFCIACYTQLTPTQMWNQQQNIFTDRMYGKAPLYSGAALYLFAKGGPVQKIVHRLKYKNRPDLGIKTGETLGRHLTASPYFQSIDMIIPVPLHPKKEKERGYNQAGAISTGLSDAMLVEQVTDVLIRKTHRKSQTTLGRLDRYANVHEVYTVQNLERLKGKHVLLVDDVLTTGATLGTCADLLLKAGVSKISAVTLAIAL